MHNFANHSASGWVSPPSRQELIDANVHPETGLATDFLNLFNEYIMLAELVCDGSMDHDVLSDWLPVDYETHFVRSGFAGADVVLASYRSMESSRRLRFENEVNELIGLILEHQTNSTPPVTLISDIQHNRDRVAALISESESPCMGEVEDAQSAIDALFD